MMKNYTLYLRNVHSSQEIYVRHNNACHIQPRKQMSNFISQTAYYVLVTVSDPCLEIQIRWDSNNWRPTWQDGWSVYELRSKTVLFLWWSTGVYKQIRLRKRIHLHPNGPACTQRSLNCEKKQHRSKRIRTLFLQESQTEGHALLNSSVTFIVTVTFSMSVIFQVTISYWPNVIFLWLFVPVPIACPMSEH